MLRPRTAIISAALMILAMDGEHISARTAQSARAEQRSGGQQAGASATDFKPFLGTWKGSYQGQVFAILTFRENRGELEGALNNFDLGRDRDGNLDDDTHIDFGTGPIFNVHVKPDGVYFLAVQKDQYSPSTEWKFLPKNANEGELTQLGDGKPIVMSGVVAKPILLLREHPKR